MPLDLDATSLLTTAGAGDAPSAERLVPLVYDELRRLAQTLLNREHGEITLQATALVHEIYLKLIDQSRATWRDELHFMAFAATAMRRILVDHARSRRRLKRGGKRGRMLLDSRIIDQRAQPVEFLAFHELLESLAAEEPRAAAIVELRFFGGMTVQQAATHLNISEATADRDWRFARAWLLHRIEGDGRQLPM